jgi:SAM-dependent methyltransferase
VENAAGLPDYDAFQESFHRCFQAELYGMIDGLGLTPGARILDAPCGNGFFSRRLADRVSPVGGLTLVDGNPTYLGLARGALRDTTASVEFVRGDVYQLPFPDASFEFVWCAQSLISLEYAERALGELARVTVPGGQIAVLEADEFHHVLLPWPIELELAIQRALARSAEVRYGSGSRLAPSRFLRRTLAEAGWQPERKVTFTSDRQAPFREWERDFLIRHLQHISQTVRTELPPGQRAEFNRLADPNSAESFLSDPDVEFTCLNVLHRARKP